MRRPLFIGIVNALVPGLGYLLIKERIGFGTLVLFGTALAALLLFVEPGYGTSFFLAVTPLGKTLEIAASISLVLAFGYDAYRLAADKPELSRQIVSRSRAVQTDAVS